MKTNPRAVDNRIDLHLIRLIDTPILHQLAIEEAFLRTDKRNICIVNSGTPPAIVMGISGKVESLVDTTLWQSAPVPLIKRFSGGGTVFVDSSTVFITWICNSDDIGVPGCPKEIHRWSERQYQSAFPQINMQLKENDYVIENRKFGGNAQYLTKGRWLHHSSLLWDYQIENMRYLLMPAKRPEYRQNRLHDAFLCKLNEYFPTIHYLKETFLSSLPTSFNLHEIEHEEIQEVLQRPHRKATEEFSLSRLPHTGA